jgi:hypothetical protein
VGEKMSSNATDFNCDIDWIQAELAAKEKEALEVIKEDICKWLSGLISELGDISPVTFVESLDTGVALCKIVALIQQSATAALESGKKLNFTVPMAALSCSTKAERGSFFARDNTANFIGWCRELGVEEAVIFESEGLVLHRDEKRVILCLLDVARYAERVGISPPELVRMEREIEQLEASEGAGERSPVPVPWESEVEEKQQEKEASTSKEYPLTPPPIVATQDKDSIISPTASKAPKLLTAEPSCNQEREESANTVTRSTPEQKKSQNDAVKHLASSSSRKVHYTPSRIPVPIGGSIRTHRRNVAEPQNVQLATRQLRKRQREEEQEPEEEEGNGDTTQKAKKLKISPVSTLATSPVKNSPQDKLGDELVANVEKRYESVDEKVCCDLSHLITNCI